MKSPLAIAAVVIVSTGLLSGCSPIVHVDPAGAATNAKCASVSINLPTTVSTLGVRTTDAQGTGAWGTPTEIVLKCGVPVPGPSTLVCVTVNGVDWLRKADKDEVFVFTTYGRTPAVSVTINAKDVKADANKALTDLASAVSSIPSKHRCLAPSETLQNGQPVDTPTTGATPAPSATPTPTPTKQP